MQLIKFRVVFSYTTCVTVAIHNLSSVFFRLIHPRARDQSQIHNRICSKRNNLVLCKSVYILLNDVSTLADEMHINQ